MANYWALTELFGYPGTGKTQLCITASATSLLTSPGLVFYVDTKGDFSPDRILEVLEWRSSQSSPGSLKASVGDRLRLCTATTTSDLAHEGGPGAEMGRPGDQCEPGAEDCVEDGAMQPMWGEEVYITIVILEMITIMFMTPCCWCPEYLTQKSRSRSGEEGQGGAVGDRCSVTLGSAGTMDNKTDWLTDWSCGTNIILSMSTFDIQS